MSETIKILADMAEAEKKKSEIAAMSGVSDYYYHQGKEVGLLKAIEIIKRCGR